MKIAMVELSKSHEECIYSQLTFLKKSGMAISLFAHPSIINQISYITLFSTISVFNFDELRGLKSFQNQVKLAQELSNFDRVIFNTASSSKQLRNIAFLLLFFKVKCIGILHHTKKLQKSFTQTIISLKIKKYFVLSDFLKKNAVISNTNIKIERFYPIFFPDFKKQKLKKNTNEIWFCIPGRVEFERRDYFFLINQLKQNKIVNNVKFLILGNINTKDGAQFKTAIAELNLLHYFIFFDKFISNSQYYNYIEQSNYILPLLKKEDESYLKYKISGAFNLAFGFKKTLFCNEFYREIPDLNENGLFYSDKNFAQKINSITQNLPQQPYTNKKWKYNFQYTNYINFIKSWQ